MGILGIFTLLGIAYLLSNNKDKDLSFYKLYCNDSLNPVNDRIKILKKKSERS